LSVPHPTDANLMQSQGTALYFASLNGHLEVVQLLLEKRADTDVANKSGQTPLHVAQTPEIAQALLDAGCDVYATNKVRFTARPRVTHVT
jgi:ankyrin repeat protein